MQHLRIKNDENIINYLHRKLISTLPVQSRCNLKFFGLGSLEEGRFFAETEFADVKSLLAF